MEVFSSLTGLPSLCRLECPWHRVVLSLGCPCPGRAQRCCRRPWTSERWLTNRSRRCWTCQCRRRSRGFWWGWPRTEEAESSTSKCEQPPRLGYCEGEPMGETQCQLINISFGKHSHSDGNSSHDFLLKSFKRKHDILPSNSHSEWMKMSRQIIF